MALSFQNHNRQKPQFKASDYRFNGFNVYAVVIYGGNFAPENPKGSPLLPLNFPKILKLS